MLPEKVVSYVELEMLQIDRLFESYRGLFDKCQENEPSLIELTALASVLHSFYNGVEKIFQIIAKRIDRSALEGMQWHRDLLVQMSKELPHRGQFSVMKW